MASANTKSLPQKKGMSKKKKIITIVIVAVLAVAAFFLFRYDDGALKVKDGAVVTEGDNWLIANGSNMQGGRRYYKLGETAEQVDYEMDVSGWTRLTHSGAVIAAGESAVITVAEAGSDGKAKAFGTAVL